MIIRDATPEDASFLAKCLIAGMHFYDFETEIPENKDIYLNLVECEKRTDLLYTYKDSRIAEVDGKVVGSLLSYPGDKFKELRQRSFEIFWPDYMRIDEESEQETGPGEYYLDTIAVLPEYQDKGVNSMIFSKIGQGMIDNGIKYVESTRELEDNHSVQNIWGRFEHKLHKRARVYIKNL